MFDRHRGATQTVVNVQSKNEFANECFKHNNFNVKTNQTVSILL